MTRTLTIAAVLAGASSAVILVVGCDLGSVAPAGGFQDGGPTTIDAAGSGPGSGSCVNKATPTQSGNHNQGMACIAVGCHLPGDPTGTAAGAPGFILGGTVYADTGGTTPVAGATVFVMENNVLHTLVSAGDGSGVGNFYVMASGANTTITGPGSAAATTCPNLLMMANSLTTPVAGGANDGNCNRSGCHNTGTDDIGRIHI